MTTCTNVRAPWQQRKSPGAANALCALTVVGDVFVVTNRPLRRIAYAESERMGLALSIREVITSHDSSKDLVVTRSALMSYRR